MPTLDGKRCAAIEILLGTPRILELIGKGDILAIKENMEKGKELGMQTFEMALFDLINEGKISMEEGLKNADSANNLRLRFTLAKSEEERAQEAEEKKFSLSLQDDEPAEAVPAEDPVKLAAGGMNLRPRQS